MLTVGDRIPAFKLKAVTSLEPGQEFSEITQDSHAGQWQVLFFWPMDFTFVCPTEIAEFGRRDADFRDRDARVLGVSTDTQFVHLAWRKAHPDLKALPFPMLAGVLHKEEGVPLRATFVIDPQGVIRYVGVHDLSVGRSVDEVMRVLDALQTDELCPCNWKKGDPTLEAA